MTRHVSFEVSHRTVGILEAEFRQIFARVEDEGVGTGKALPRQLERLLAPGNQGLDTIAHRRPLHFRFHPVARVVAHVRNIVGTWVIRCNLHYTSKLYLSQYTLKETFSLP